MNQPAPTSQKAPKSRGRIMDFTPRKPIVIARPTPEVKPVIKMPAPRPAPQPAPQPIAAPAPRPAPRPLVKKPRLIVHPPIRKRPLSQPMPQPAPQPVPQPKPAPQPEPKPKPKLKPEPKPEPKPKSTPLGTRSPFLKSSVVVEKRPLSGGASTSTRSRVPRSAVPSYHQSQLARSNAIKPASRKSKLPLVLLIAGTILIGAAVGACAYFLVFQGE